MKHLNFLSNFRWFATIILLITLCIGKMWGTNFNTTYNYSGQGTSWSITNATATDNTYYKTSSTNDCVVTVPGIFTGKTITSNVVITLDVACFGNGDNPTSSKFSIYNSSACTSQVTASQGGTLPNNSTYRSTTYTITQANATAGFTNDLVIKIASGTKLIRFRSFTVTFTYTDVTYNVYLMSGCTGGSYSSNKGTSGSGSGGYSSCVKYSGISSGTSVTITATPSSGYQFDGWEDGGYSIIFDEDDGEITPSSATSTTATFTMPSKDVVIWQCNFSVACAKSVTINKGASTNCSFSLSKSGAQASCDGVATTVSITPNTGYGTPVVTQSGASVTPTISGSGNTQTVTYAANTTGTSAISVSCSANNYTISLDNESATTSGTANITATYNDDNNLDGTPAITIPAKTGWTFGGYYTAKQGGGTQIIGADGNVIASVSGYTDASKNWVGTSDVTLYAKWTCTVTWSVNKQTNVYSQQTVTYNSAGSKVATVPDGEDLDLENDYCGDKFMGWTSDENYVHGTSNLFTNVAGSPNLNSTGNTTFYAVFADEEQ